jgi:hypothetical protein
MQYYPNEPVEEYTTRYVYYIGSHYNIAEINEGFVENVKRQRKSL